jgi:hypothetical protein
MANSIYHILEDSDINSIVQGGKNKHSSSSADVWGNKFISFLGIAGVTKDLADISDVDMNRYVTSFFSMVSITLMVRWKRMMELISKVAPSALDLALWQDTSKKL